MGELLGGCPAKSSTDSTAGTSAPSGWGRMPLKRNAAKWGSASKTSSFSLASNGTAPLDGSSATCQQPPLMIIERADIQSSTLLPGSERRGISGEDISSRSAVSVDLASRQRGNADTGRLKSKMFSDARASDEALARTLMQLQQPHLDQQTRPGVGAVGSLQVPLQPQAASGMLAPLPPPPPPPTPPPNDSMMPQAGISMMSIGQPAMPPQAPVAIVANHFQHATNGGAPQVQFADLMMQGIPALPQAQIGMMQAPPPLLSMGISGFPQLPPVQAQGSFGF